MLLKVHQARVIEQVSRIVLDICKILLFLVWINHVGSLEHIFVNLCYACFSIPCIASAIVQGVGMLLATLADYISPSSPWFASFVRYSSLFTYSRNAVMLLNVA